MDMDKIAELRKDLALYPNLDIVGLLRGVVTILLDAAEGYENSEKENSLLRDRISVLEGRAPVKVEYGVGGKE
jgi:hypothetical protein